MEQMDTIYLGKVNFVTNDSSEATFRYLGGYGKDCRGTFFTATVYDAEVKLTEEFGIPMIKRYQNPIAWNWQEKNVHLE